ncbi:hypothetical protein DLJ53_22140 [Acuticoccus sediminis]|uniref:Uncharacterized protein n=1 Tax=Acuticoccus sediminis TaxID=2184697 RepID=A0A8B2NUC2_9HYPH|nr:SGNH/GDSL hydrolase family protein [Acuticoccus sediminis]RAH99246.1 hypothetical protein DLJ53_22140 [Acuticoccus sediminis]
MTQHGEVKAAAGPSEPDAAPGASKTAGPDDGRKVLVVGFSNTLMFGYAPRLKQSFMEARDGIDFVRVGLGAQQPHVVPAFIRLAARLHGPFSHVLFEINTSAFTRHPLSSDELAVELLSDIVLTAQEVGAEPGFVILYRDYGDTRTIDFNALTRTFCAAHGVPVLDRAEGLLAERGEPFVRSILRDDVHTTPEGSRFIADEILPFLLDHIERPLTRRPLTPRFRRGYLDILDRLPTGTAVERMEASNLGLDYAVVNEGETLTVDLGRDVVALGLVYLYGPYGGQADLRFGADSAVQALVSMDRMSHVTRIAVHPFASHRGMTGRTLRVGNLRDLAEVVPLRGDKTPPVRQYVGPLLTLDPA